MASLFFIEILRIKKNVYSIVLIAIIFCFISTATAQNIAAPIIQCVSTDQSTGDVTISWSNYTADACGTFTEFVVLGATNILGPFSTVGTVANINNTNYIHVGANGTLLNWFYRIIAIHNCPGATYDTSAVQQEEVLSIPDINYVTVLNNGSVEVNWQPSVSSQTDGYYVYYFLGGGLSNLIDSTLNINDTIYNDVNASTNSNSLVYSVASFDFCDNRSLINPNAHRTIFLTQSIFGCAGTIDLRWNTYQNWPIGVQYQIETTIDNGTPIISTSLPDNSTGYNFETDTLNGDSICFRIIANHPNGIYQSASNKVCLPIDFIRSTAFNYLRTLTVNNDGDVELSWIIDTTADITDYLIENALASDSSSFLVKDSIAATIPISLQNNFTDTSPTTESQSYYYRVVSKDACDFTKPSTLGKTILLTAELDGNNIVQLDWNQFRLEFATVINYSINRISSTNVLSPLSTEGPLVTLYEDDIAAVATNDGNFCYVIEATYNLNLPGFAQETLTSRSNIACVEREPVIYMASALVPSGINKTIRPVLQVPNIKEYQFIVYDRWGKKIFETSALTAGWDGTNKGEALPFGSYTYMVKVVSQNGTDLVKKGTIVLVR